MSIAYLDPGNIESDLQAGAVAEYKVRNTCYVSQIDSLLNHKSTMTSDHDGAVEWLGYIYPWWQAESTRRACPFDVACGPLQ